MSSASIIFIWFWRRFYFKKLYISIHNASLVHFSPFTSIYVHALAYLGNNVITSNMFLLTYPCRKVLACVVCGRLKSAFQIASRSGSVADVQYVAHQVILSQFRLHYGICKVIGCFTIRHSKWGMSPCGKWRLTWN